ncbi:ABC transporter substrate-binding protein [Hoyosella altamirensis]|uniref:Iron complex transport system substrate-binding protein n=1 Tax=Hoyosella altamirensis TaxID=616997 RepID=A0A839RM70_9ACTN|nr:ABC transporter substrate-binding protein [Hoyosella altamirensis]MBB3037031.1 iron complex transport system substrate-binding protein [Hoyosella altamirensis]
MSASTLQPLGITESVAFDMIVGDLTRRSFFTGMAATTLAAAAACSTTDATDGLGNSETRTITTHYRPVEVPRSPQRVIAASYWIPFQMYAIGVRPIGVYDYSGNFDQLSPAMQEFISNVSVIGSWADLEIEAIAALQPDLIIGNAMEIDEGVFASLSRIAPTAVFSADTRADWMTILDGVADSLNQADALNGLRAEYERTVAEIAEKYLGKISEHTWASVSFGHGEGEFSLQHPDSAAGALLAAIGVEFGRAAAATGTEYSYTTYSTENFTVIDDVTLVVHPVGGRGEPLAAVEAVLAQPTFQATPAAQTGQVYGVRSLYDVNDYRAAIDALRNLEATVLAQL